MATATALVPTRDVVAGRAPSAAPATAARRADSPRQPGEFGAPRPLLPVPPVERCRRGLSASDRRDAARPAAAVIG